MVFGKGQASKGSRLRSHLKAAACFVAAEPSCSGRKTETGESVNFRLKQMDFVAFILHA